MSARNYFAWDMLTRASYEDERREGRKLQADMRDRLDPLRHISENNFIKDYRLNKEAFEDLCDLLQYYTDLKASQWVSLESKVKDVLCALLFYAHGSYQRITGMANHFSQEATSVYIEEVTAALNHPSILKIFIKFPTTQHERDAIRQSFYIKYGIPGVIGCIDCSHFKIFNPGKEVEHLYYCRKHYHSMNVQMICDHSCYILSINAKFGGAAHDAFIWENSNVNDYMQNLHRCNEIVWLLGDSGYPQRPWLMTPYSTPTQNVNEENFNAVHTSARVIIENTFGRLKNRWRCLLSDRSLHYTPEKCAKIIIACSVLHNIALKYNVPDPEEPSQGTEEQFERQELVYENQGDSDLVMGRALRNQLAQRLAARNQ